jgi:REP element-mobilizing transposase RayT
LCGAATYFNRGPAAVTNQVIGEVHMALWRTYYHLVWATRERIPLITETIERQLYGYILGKAVAMDSLVHAIGGVEDHIHVVASIPPKHAIADVVKRWKGSSSHFVNRDLSALISPAAFRWQRGYGVFSLGRTQLSVAVRYVRKQRAHHAEGTVMSTLEVCPYEDDAPELWRDGEAVAGIPVV